MSDLFVPKPEHKFTFGLWTVGNPGRDPFGHEVRPQLDPVESVHRLAELGAYGGNFHDDDLVPPGSSAAERDALVARVRAALDQTGLRVPSCQWPRRTSLPTRSSRMGPSPPTMPRSAPMPCRRR